ncbi:hypothetical protein BKI52_35115 [marine bacterium AO1-C]|nr:hypothetical protein BKI52_35115 [marine bacterium AO1-C]
MFFSFKKRLSQKKLGFVLFDIRFLKLYYSHINAYEGVLKYPFELFIISILLYYYISKKMNTENLTTEEKEKLAKITEENFWQIAKQVQNDVKALHDREAEAPSDTNQ